MKRISKLGIIIIVAVITCLASFATPASADNGQGNINKHDQIIVQSEPGSARSDVGKSHEAASAIQPGQGANEVAANQQPQPMEQPVNVTDNDAQTALPDDNHSANETDMTTPELTDGDQDTSSMSDRLLVKFEPGISRTDIEKVNQEVGGTIKSMIPDVGVYVIESPRGQGAAKLTAYHQHKEVQYAEPDAVTQAADIPDDTYFGSQWNMSMVRATEAWNITQGSPNVSIAILDTGIDLSHPDLQGKVISSVNFSTSTTVSDLYGHGTHVAGIAAAATNNGVGVAGLGYNSSLMNVKVMNDDGIGTYSALIQGIVWAADKGAEVINMSLGGSSASSALQDAVEYAWNKGVVLVAAAGNNASSTPFYPAYYQSVMATAATDKYDQRTVYSNYGDWVDVAAPGDNIYSTVPARSGSLCSPSGYRSLSGTSMASPHVAGLAALVFTQVVDINGNGLLNDEVRARIQDTAEKTVSGIGSGRINAYAAVTDSPAGGGTIGGSVVDSATSIPIKGASITDGVRITSSDASGNYFIQGVPPGSYTVTASATGYASVAWTTGVKAGTNSLVNFSLAKSITGTISGTVKDATTGALITGASVSDGMRNATTDANGSYTISNVPPGKYTVTASAAGYLSSSQAVSVSGTSSSASVSFGLVPDSQNMWVASIVFKVNGTNLRITVNVASDSGILSGVTVKTHVTNWAGQSWDLSGTTDTYGRFIFMLQKPVISTYIATITDISAAGYSWLADKGVKSASYVLSAPRK